MWAVPTSSAFAGLSETRSKYWAYASRPANLRLLGLWELVQRTFIWGTVQRSALREAFSGNIHPEVLEASPSMFTYCNYVLVVSPFMSQRLNQVSIHRHRWIQPCKADSVFHYWGRTQQRMNESEVNNCAMNAFGGSIFACPEKWVWHESTRTSLTAQILYSQPRNMPRLIKPSVVSPKLGPCVPK